MSPSFRTSDGFILRAYASMYLDWGLIISWSHDDRMRPERWMGDDPELYANPSCLSGESYGRKPADRFEDWDEAERAALDGDDGAFVPWTDDDWLECLEREAEGLIEAYLGDEIWGAKHPIFGGKAPPAWLEGLNWEVADASRSRTQFFLHGRGGKKLSVVGGQGLYSEPREIVPVSEYSRMEVGIMPGLASPQSVGFDEALCDRFELEDESGGVAGYVPVEIIREMALALANSQKEA